ncbi:MAG: FAD-dependent thymidylate synthase [Lachnospiraceae bacterium]|nr:FAD-dependent thymidylate synthase [Lachnospiraceae bacterium]
MELVKPYAKLWNLPNDELTVKCAQLCYASEKPPKDINAWLEEKWNNGHKSIFRHATYYYAIPIIVCTEKMRDYFKISPYVGYYENNEWVFVSINGQTYREVPWFHHLFKYSTSEFGLLGFINNEEDREGINKILRKTVLVQTQISTSRELNRTSPNNICEQSTRYCNFTQDKFDGKVKICEPWWFKDEENAIQNHYLRACDISTNVYRELINFGMKPQDARGVLPLDTATKVVYTYRIEEWKHILNLRYYGETGKPHPNAKISANQIREVLNTCFDYEYFPESYDQIF